jgi:hypothetical protein
MTCFEARAERPASFVRLAADLARTKQKAPRELIARVQFFASVDEGYISIDEYLERQSKQVAAPAPSAEIEDGLGDADRYEDEFLFALRDRVNGQHWPAMATRDTKSNHADASIFMLAAFRAWDYVKGRARRVLSHIQQGKPA